MQDPGSINRIIRSALDSFFIKDYDTAINELKSAEVLDRENPEILYNIAIAYCRLEFYNSAVEYLKKVLSLELKFIDSVTVKKLIAYCHINMGDFTSALTTLNEINSGDFTDTQVLSMTGYCHEKTGNYDAALDFHKKVLNLDKHNLNSINAFAYISAQKGKNLDKAMQLAKFICGKDKNNAAFVDTLGYIFLKAGKLKEAEAQLKKAAIIAPFSLEIQDHIKELNLLKKNL